MKKTELIVGEEYAVGGTSRYKERRRARLIGLDEPISVAVGFAGRGGTVEKRGMVFELCADDGPASPWKFPPGAVQVGAENPLRLLVPTGQYVWSSWADHTLAQGRRAVQARAEQQERARLGGLLDGIVQWLTGLGMAPGASTGIMVWAGSRMKLELDPDAADALMRRFAKRPVVPPGYRIEKQELLDYIRPERKGQPREVTFDVIEVVKSEVVKPDEPDAVADVDETSVAMPSVWFSAREGEWLINAGGTTSCIEPGEARARAAALLMAAEECERQREAERA